MKDQLSSPSAVAQAEKKNRQVGGRLYTQSIHTQIHILYCVKCNELELHGENYVTQKCLVFCDDGWILQLPVKKTRLGES